MAEAILAYTDTITNKTGDILTGAQEKTKKLIGKGADYGGYYAGRAVNKAAHGVIGAIYKTPEIGARFIEGATGLDMYGWGKSKNTEQQPGLQTQDPNTQIQTQLTMPALQTRGEINDDRDVYYDASDEEQGSSSYTPAETRLPWYYSDEKKSQPWYYSEGKNISSIGFLGSTQKYVKIFILILLALLIFTAVEFTALPNKDECLKSSSQKVYNVLLLILLLIIPLIIFSIMFGYYSINFGYILTVIYFLSIVTMFIKTECSYGDYRYIKIIFLFILFIFLLANKIA